VDPTGFASPPSPVEQDPKATLSQNKHERTTTAIFISANNRKTVIHNNNNNNKGTSCLVLSKWFIYYITSVSKPPRPNVAVAMLGRASISARPFSTRTVFVKGSLHQCRPSQMLQAWLVRSGGIVVEDFRCLSSTCGPFRSVRPSFFARFNSEKWFSPLVLFVYSSRPTSHIVYHSPAQKVTRGLSMKILRTSLLALWGTALLGKPINAKVSVSARRCLHCHSVK